MCVLVVFIFSPTILLILYPTRLFKRCISCCKFHRWHALHMFVESFQRQYKSGNSGRPTCDFEILIFVFCIHSLKSSSSELQFVYFTGVSCCYQYEAVL